MTARLVVVVALAAAATLSIAAEPLSLDEALLSALRYNTDLRAADDQARAAGDRAKSAWGAALPQVNARYMARRSDNPLDAFADKLNTRSVTAADLSPAAINQPGDSTLHATQLSVELPLYTGGRVSAGIREAGAHAEAARLAFERRREITAFRTLQAYRSAQAAGEGSTIARDAAEAAREHAETTARLVRQGRSVPSDRMTAELSHSAAESQREQAASRERQAIEELRIVAALPPDAAIALPGWQAAAVDDAPIDALEAENRAIAHRKDLQAQEAWLRVTRARITAARSAFQPQVGVIATDSWYDRNAALENKSQSIMGVVSFNIFSGGRDHHALSAAHHETDEAEQRLEAMRQGVRNDVRSALSRLQETRARARLAESGVDKARENVRLVKQRYGEGRTILIDLLMAERMLVEARNEALQAGLARELAQAALLLAQGAMPLPGEIPAGGRQSGTTDLNQRGVSERISATPPLTGEH